MGIDPIQRRIQGCRSIKRALLSVALLGSVRVLAARETATPLPPAATGEVDFEKQVRPILERKCFACHGPTKQESGLRLDHPGGGLEGGDLGPAYVPGDSAKSPLIQYVAGTDESILMPPADSQFSRLTVDEIGLLRAWIDQGARWPSDAELRNTKKNKKSAKNHWAFQIPVFPTPPTVQNPGWVRNPIDTFILSRLEQSGLSPADEADRHAIIRRLALDLTGLPPTLAEINTFITDSTERAYENLVERLLESPHYGERWALWWLDLARYADTNGYEIDRPRSIWLYRDWVVDAFNANMPFDQFTIEQMAGDLLPNATLSQRIATGFHRNTFTNEEGGHNWEQFRWESIVDRVHTTSTAFLGLTMACAQCHDHKYDPISQREYYQFFAFLNNDDEPLLEVPEPDVVARRQQILTQISRAEAEMASKFPPSDNPEQQSSHLSAAFERWRREVAQDIRSWTLLKPVRWHSKHNTSLTLLEDGSLLACGDNPETESHEIVYQAPATIITGIRLEALPDPSLPLHGPGRGYLKEDGTFQLSEVQVAVAGDVAEQGNPHKSVLLKNPKATIAIEGIAQAIDSDKLTGWHIKGGAGRRHTATFEFAEPIDLPADGAMAITLLQNFGHEQTLGRFRMWATCDAAPLQATTMPVEVEQLLLKAPEQWSASELHTVRKYYLSIAPELKAEQAEIESLRQSSPALPTTLVLQHRSERRRTHQHIRGVFQRRGPEVDAGVPMFLHALPEGSAPNRLTLARWLVDRKNPLIGRVIMNQIWQNYFGRGLVSTPEDFGVQGSKPSHPELLDWLACEFMSNGWDLKHMHRAIVTSSTYRQSAVVSADKLNVDPENVLISRGPRFRLHAETIRDIALVASGLLNQRLGGPSVFPVQPASVVESAFGDAHWPTSSGTDRYRRSIYTHRKRAAPFAAFTAFDAPPHHSCIAKRMRSNTPLQALARLNDSVIVESAQAVARRVVREGSSDDESRLNLAFQLCLTRDPRPDERKALALFIQDQRERLQTDPVTASQVVGRPDRPPGEVNDHVDLAAWTLVARVLLNLDETMNKE